MCLVRKENEMEGKEGKGREAEGGGEEGRGGEGGRNGELKEKKKGRE